MRAILSFKFLGHCLSPCLYFVNQPVLCAEHGQDFRLAGYALFDSLMQSFCRVM